MARSDGWDIEISARRPLFELDLTSLWRYRDLIAMFVQRDFVAFYKQTVLGPLWYVVQPLLTTSVFTLVFNRIANIPTDGLPPFLFYLTGLVLWNYFAACMTKTSDTFTANAGIFGKIYFPRLTVPVAVVITNLVTFAIQFLLVCAFLAFYSLRSVPVQVNGWLFVLPLLVLHVAALALGVGILLSSMTTRYRDMTFLVGFGAQLWLYATPIVYPLSQVPERWQWIMALNPMTPVVEIFRKALLGTGTVHASHILVSVCISVALLLLGLVMFSRIARTSTDTV
ncbi:MAG TPA: ABC transporter permease [Rudaea sp.]|nr:ABC transporter permease [Rudaea sp.]